MCSSSYSRPRHEKPAHGTPALPLLQVGVWTLAAGRDEALDARLEHRQRYRAELEHGVVEGADIEAITECLLGALASLDDGALAEVVGQRLPRPCDVAIHLGADLVLGERGVLTQVSERLLTRPALRMNAGVDHEPRGAPDLVAEHAEALVWGLVHPHLVSEPLAVERPPLAVGRDVAQAADFRLILVLHRDRDLEGVTGSGLMQRECHQVVERAARQIVGIEKVD